MEPHTDQILHEAVSEVCWGPILYICRVINRIDEDSSTVWVLEAGIRKEDDQKDVYRIAKKLLKAGLLDLVCIL